MQKFREQLQRMSNWLSLHRWEVVAVASFVLVIASFHPLFADTSSTAVASTSGAGSIGPMDRLALYAAEFMSWIAQQVTKFIVILIDLVIVPIMQYAHFVDAPIVTQGWVVVRDLVNMLFVVVLLVIAFQTIFGSSRAHWQQQVPRLLIMAVVINFSRTIAGIMIDFGQVVMLTFVNAIANVAGGNFIQLFGLDKLFSFSNDAIAQASKSGVGFEAYDFLGAAFLTLILVFLILATMTILAGLLAFRIVILWCLVIVSPLTFFLGGAKGVVGSAESYYADWWKRFTSAVTLGPILTFFVWLALAAASTGNLAEKQGFNVQKQANGDEAASIGGEITKAFDAPHLTSLIIALALLSAGFEVSMQTAGSIGGRAGSIASSGVKGIPGLARSLARIGVPAAIATGAPALTAAGAGIALAGKAGWNTSGLTKFREDFVGNRAKGVRNVGTAMANSGIPLVAGAGRTLQTAGFSVLQNQAKHKEHEVQEVTKELEGMSFENKLILANTQTNGATSEKQKLLIEVAGATLPQSKKKWASINGESGDTRGDKILEKTMHAFGEVGGDLPEKDKDKHGSTTLVGFPKAAAFDPDMKTREQKKNAIISQLKTVANSTEKISQIQRLNFEGENGDLFQEAAKEVVDKEGRSIWSKMESGHADSEVKKWFEANKTALVTKSQNQISDAQKAVQAASSGATLTQITKAREDVAAGRINKDPTKNTALENAMNNLATVMRGLTAKEVQGGAVSPAALASADVAMAFGMHASKEALGAMDPAMRVAFNNSLDSYGAAVDAKKVTSPGIPAVPNDHINAEINQVEAARSRSGEGPGSYNRVTGEFNDGAVAVRQKEILDRRFRIDPTIVVDLGDALSGFGFKNQLADEVAKAFRNSAKNGTTDDGKEAILELNKQILAPRSNFDSQDAYEANKKRVIATVQNLQQVLENAAGDNSEAKKKLAEARGRWGV